MDDSDLLKELRLQRSDREGDDRGRRWLWIVGVVAAAIAVIIAWLTLHSGAMAVEVASVQPQSAHSGPLAVLEATGYVTARREATVASKITGKLTAVLVEEGDHVTEGQVLARLEDSDQLARESLASAQVDAAKSKRVETATRLAQARRDYRRQQQLREKGLNSEQQLEDARTNASALADQLNAAKAQVAVAVAQLRSAKVDVNDTIVRAPFTGVVIDKTAQAGEIVSPVSAGGGFTRTGICTLVDMDSLEIDVDVNEAYINRVHAGQSTETVLDAYPGWKIPGHVIAIVPTADRSKATVKVRVSIDSRDSRIVPDMGARVSFLQPASPNSATTGVLVPATAIVERNGKHGVFVVANGRAHLKTVQPGQQFEQLYSVTGGLDAGEIVVVDPPAALTDGDRVRITAKGADSG